MSRYQRLLTAVRHVCRLLAVAFWYVGMVRAADALRISGTPDVPEFWSWINAVFGLGFFWIASLLWLEGRHIGRERDRETSPR